MGISTLGDSEMCWDLSVPGELQELNSKSAISHRIEITLIDDTDTVASAVLSCEGSVKEKVFTWQERK